jgi:DNA-binding transcriptional LysR family regulator
VGLRLFNRSTRNVSLTDAGERYFAKCEHIIEEAQNAHAELTDLRTRPSGLIRVSTPAGFAEMWLIPLLPQFGSQYPELELDLNCSQIVPNLISDPVDVALRAGPVEQPDAVARLIWREESGLYASPDYLRRRGVPRKPQDLLRHECLGFSTGATVLPWVLAHADGRRTETIIPGGKMRINYLPALHDLALLGMGITICW